VYMSYFTPLEELVFGPTSYKILEHEPGWKLKPSTPEMSLENPAISILGLPRFQVFRCDVSGSRFCLTIST